MAIKISGSNIIDDNRHIVNAGVITATSAVVGSGVTITSGGIDAVGLAITAASFSGDGSGLSNTGSTLSATSGTERVVLTNLTSGTMTASSTDADLTFNASTNTLNVVNVNATGITTAAIFSEELNNVGNTSTAATIDLSNGTFVTATLTGNCTFTFSNPSGSNATSFTLVLSNDGTAGRTITWPASVKWPNATVPTRTTTANKTDVYTFFTYDGGTTWWGTLSLYNFS